MFIHSLNPNQHYKTEAPWKPCWWSLLQGPWTSSQPTFWWFSAVKRWCRARDSGLKFELGAGAKSTVSWAPLAMTERPSDATRLVTGQNSEFFFYVVQIHLRYLTMCLVLPSVGEWYPFNSTLDSWWQSSYLLGLPWCGRHSQQCDSSSWNCSRCLKALELLFRL